MFSDCFGRESSISLFLLKILTARVGWSLCFSTGVGIYCISKFVLNILWGTAGGFFYCPLPCLACLVLLLPHSKCFSR